MAKDEVDILELKSVITEMKNSIEVLSSRKMNQQFEMIQSEDQKEKRMKENEQLQRPGEHHQVSQHLRDESSRRRWGKGSERILEEIIARNFPNLMENKKLYIQEAQ